MSSALILVAVLAGAFFFWHARKALDDDLRGRALSLSREIAVLVNDDIITGNRTAIYKKITSPFIASRDTSSVSDLLFIMVYNHTCNLLIGSTPNEVFFGNDSYFHTIPSGPNLARAAVFLNCESVQSDEPFLQVKKTGTYDLTYPVYMRDEKIGYVRIGLSGQRLDRQDLRLLTVFSNLAGAALQNASLYTDLAVKVNELRSTQEQLVHSTKMAAIGELATNVAHEVNNPLTSVLGYTTHLLKTLDAPEPARRMLGMMEQETLRVRKIIRNLLDFSSGRASRMKPSDLLLPLKETIACNANG